MEGGMCVCGGEVRVASRGKDRALRAAFPSRWVGSPELHLCLYRTSENLWQRSGPAPFPFFPEPHKNTKAPLGDSYLGAASWDPTIDKVSMSQANSPQVTHTGCRGDMPGASKLRVYNKQLSFQQIFSVAGHVLISKPYLTQKRTKTLNKYKS